MAPRIPAVVDGHLHLGPTSEASGGAGGRADQAGEPAIAVDSAAWFAWLAAETTRSFAFGAPTGTVTASKERRARGAGYWYAYRKQAGRRLKAYLGRSEELTLARLIAVAATLNRADRPEPDARQSLPARPALAPPSSPDLAPAAPGLAALLTTKLFMPAPRADIVPRARLLARLDAGLAGRLTLLCAPAGFGKTTLLAGWLRTLDRPVAWLALDEADQDAGQFLRYLVATGDWRLRPRYDLRRMRLPAVASYPGRRRHHQAGGRRRWTWPQRDTTGQGGGSWRDG